MQLPLPAGRNSMPALRTTEGRSMRIHEIQKRIATPPPPTRLIDDLNSLCRAVDAAKWIECCDLLERVAGRIDRGHWTATGYTPLPGTNYYKGRGAPGALVERLDEVCAQVRSLKIERRQEKPEVADRRVTIEEVDEDDRRRGQSLVLACLGEDR